MAESYARQKHRELLKNASEIPDKLDKAASLIEMLRQCIIEESLITGIDGSHFLDPILKRQQEVEERGLASLKHLQNEMSKGPSAQHSLSRQKALTVSVRNIMRCGEISKNNELCRLPSFNPSVPDINKTSISKAANPRKREQLPLPTENCDTASSILSGVSMSRPVETVKESIALVAENDSSHWYGSLDRNMVKKKKKSMMDKNRRHTKTVGSIAGLETSDFLQPDEEYKIGLPLSLSQLAVSENRSQIVADNGNLGGPKLPPRSTSIRRAEPVSQFRNISVLDPIVMQLNNARWGSDSLAQRPLPVPRMHKNQTTTARREAEELSKSKESLMSVRNGNGRQWFETHLDEGVVTSRRSKSEVDSTTKFEGLDHTDSPSFLAYTSKSSPNSEVGSRSSNSSEAKLCANESSKPFEMTDYFKYSVKHRNSQILKGHGASEMDLQNKNEREKIDMHSQENSNHVQQNMSPDGLREIFERQAQTSLATKGADTNGNSQIPELPPKARGGFGKKVATLPSVATQDPAYLDEDIAWVMDSPTFV